MKKESIVHFVGFVTRLNFDDFVSKWEQYAVKDNTEVTLGEQDGTSARFRYLSMHKHLSENFQFSFMNKGRSERFPEHAVKVVQTGGFVPVYTTPRRNSNSNDTRVVAFSSHYEMDMDFYGSLSQYGHLTIYKAYYENCLYEYIVDIFTPAAKVDELLQQLKTRTGIETGVYKECMIPHL